MRGPSPPLLKPRQIVVEPLKTIHVNPRSLRAHERKMQKAARPQEPAPKKKTVDSGAAARKAEERVVKRSVAQNTAKGEEGLEITVHGPHAGKGPSKVVTIDFPPNDPSGRKQFVGAVKNGKPHGPGTLVWESGSRYEGMFRRGDLNGQGTYRWSQGTEYSGQWQSGAMHGRGVMRTAGGDSYDGDWDMNRKHGRGTYAWANGDEYSGEFRDDVMHGRGECRWPNGRSVEIEFEDEFPSVANNAATTLWLCFVSLSVLFLASLFPHSPLRALHDVWPLNMGVLGGGRRFSADADGSSWRVAGVDLLSQFPYYLHLVLLFANQRLLREFFAQVIWKVAQMYCHAAGPGVPGLGSLSDGTTWRCGIALGYLSVCTFFLFSFSIVNAASSI